MKKLCTYLTLFVLGLLALAQPAAAKDYTFYFRLPSSGWTTPPGFHWWGCGANANVDGSTSSPVSMKPVTGESNLYSVTLKDANETGGNIMFKTGDSWNPQTTAITELKDGYIYEITGGSGQNCIAEPKEEYTQGGGPEPGGDPTDYTFYLNPGTVAWSDVYVMLFNSSDSNWDGFKHYSTKLSNGYYKFEVKGVTKAGNMLFKSNNDVNTWLENKTDQSRDIEGTNVKNGALYTLGEMYIDNNANKGYNYTVTENYQEPGGHVVINIRGQFIDGDHEGEWGIPDYNRTMDWNESRGIYTYEATDVATKGGQFMVSSVAGENFWNGRYESVSGGKLTNPSVQPDAANIKEGGSTDFTLPAAGTICFDLDALKIWYEPKQETLPTELWAKGPGASGDWNTTIKLESDGDGLFHFTAYAADKFVISDTDNIDTFDNTAWGPIAPGVVEVPTAMPETANVEHAHQSENDFKATATNVIWFDAKNLKLWSGDLVLPTLYTFYVKIDDSYASAWGEDKCYLYTFNEGDDKWTSVGGQCVKYDRRLVDGVYKFVVRGQSSKGRMLFKNTWGTSKEEYSGTIFPDDIKPGALYTISAKGQVPVASEEYVESNVFEAGKAYYVDASACSWFEDDNCTLGVKYDGDVHYGGTIVKVSSSPLVYRFTVNEDQTVIEVGRRNNQGLHDAVTVQAPTDGSNCIYVKEDNGVLVFDSWGTYSPASGLYILGSSNTIEGDWKNATPIAMNYDATKDVFYYMVQGTNASADHPIEFLISRGASNADFFKAENAFEPVRAGYIHMAESDYMKGKPGYTVGNYFKLISRGRVMAKYIKAEDSKEITGLKI